MTNPQQFSAGAPAVPNAGAPGAGAAPPSSNAPFSNLSAATFRIVIQNSSKYDFILDGEYFTHGGLATHYFEQHAASTKVQQTDVSGLSAASSPRVPSDGGGSGNSNSVGGAAAASTPAPKLSESILPPRILVPGNNATTQIDFTSRRAEGLLWFVETESMRHYLSVCLSTSALSSSLYGNCWIGAPPHELKHLFENKMEKRRLECLYASDDGMNGTFEFRGGGEVLFVLINPEIRGNDLVGERSFAFRTDLEGTSEVESNAGGSNAGGSARGVVGSTNAVGGSSASPRTGNGGGPAVSTVPGEGSPPAPHGPGSSVAPGGLRLRYDSMNYGPGYQHLVVTSGNKKFGGDAEASSTTVSSAGGLGGGSGSAGAAGSSAGIYHNPYQQPYQQQPGGNYNPNPGTGAPGFYPPGQQHPPGAQQHPGQPLAQPPQQAPWLQTHFDPSSSQNVTNPSLGTSSTHNVRTDEQFARQLQEEQDDQALQDFLDKTRPKDAVAGLKTGLGGILGGVVGGAVALVAVTAGSVKDAKPGAGNKALGLLRGLGLGAVAGVGTAAVGVVGGATQIARGVKAEVRRLFLAICEGRGEEYGVKISTMWSCSTVIDWRRRTKERREKSPPLTDEYRYTYSGVAPWHHFPVYSRI